MILNVALELARQEAGLLVVVTKNVRRQGRVLDLATITVELATRAASKHGQPTRPLPEICQKLRRTQPRAAP